MDTRGNLYEVDEEKKTKKNIETGKTTPFRIESMFALTDIQLEELKGKNRKQRRAWLKQHKKELIKRVVPPSDNEKG